MASVKFFTTLQVSYKMKLWVTSEALLRTPEFNWINFVSNKKLSNKWTAVRNKLEHFFEWLCYSSHITLLSQLRALIYFIDDIVTTLQVRTCTFVIFFTRSLFLIKIALMINYYFCTLQVVIVVNRIHIKWNPTYLLVYLHCLVMFCFHSVLL